MERTSRGASKYDKPSLPPRLYVEFNLDNNGRVYTPEIKGAILYYFTGHNLRDTVKQFGLNEDDGKRVSRETSQIKRDYGRDSRRGFLYASYGRHFRIRGIAGDV